MAAQMGAQMGGGVMAGRSGMPMVAGGAGGVPMGGVPMMASAGAGGMPIMAGGAATAPAGTPAMMGAFPAAGGYVPPMSASQLCTAAFDTHTHTRANSQPLYKDFFFLYAFMFL
jgi:hypothetical protein